MDVERETVVEIVVSVIAVSVFVAAVLAIGATYGDGDLSSQGALALVGAILLFVLGMSGIGLFLAYRQP